MNHQNHTIWSPAIIENSIPDISQRFQDRSSSSPIHEAQTYSTIPTHYQSSPSHYHGSSGYYSHADYLSGNIQQTIVRIKIIVLNSDNDNYITNIYILGT